MMISRENNHHNIGNYEARASSRLEKDKKQKEACSLAFSKANLHNPPPLKLTK